MINDIKLFMNYYEEHKRRYFNRIFEKDFLFGMPPSLKIQRIY